jgi:hypothetical protein
MQFGLLDAVKDAERCWMLLSAKYALEENSNFLLMLIYKLSTDSTFINKLHSAIWYKESLKASLRRLKVGDLPRQYQTVLKLLAR